MEHNWPGNVRELENVVERAVVLATDAARAHRRAARSAAASQRHPPARSEGGALPADASLFEIVTDFERRMIIERLEQPNWSQTEAAESLHVRSPR